MVKRQTLALRKMEKVRLLEIYQDVFDEWEMEVLQKFRMMYSTRGHYLAHDPVIKVSSSTFRVRPEIVTSAKLQHFLPGY